MTKQSQAHISPEEKPTAELLLRRFKLMDEIVAEVRKKNIEAGLDPKYLSPSYYCYLSFHLTPNLILPYPQTT